MTYDMALLAKFFINQARITNNDVSYGAVCCMHARLIKCGSSPKHNSLP